MLLISNVFRRTMDFSCEELHFIVIYLLFASLNIKKYPKNLFENKKKYVKITLSIFFYFRKEKG